MHIIVVGLSHMTATVELREQVAFSPNSIAKPLCELVAIDGVIEGVIVSTCNRVEIYASTRDIAGGIARVKRFMADYHRVDYERLEGHLYSYHSEAAIRHLFRVASSLDSMVVGEPQILGQIKAAYGYASEFKTSGIILNRFLHKAFSVAKRVRTETRIASSAVSVAFAAVELAKKILGELDGKTVMLIGAGEMCELAARHFIGSGAANIIVVNRTFERAERLADDFNGQAIPFDQLPEQLHRADIVLSSTGAEHAVIHAPVVESALRRRKFKPMFFIDIAVPRDIESAVNDVDSAYLFTVDDLQEIVENNIARRSVEAEKAEEIVEEEVIRFYSWLTSLEVTPTIIAMRNRFNQVREAELNRTLAAWKDISADDERRLQALTQGIINKLLHAPLTKLKQSGQGGRTDLYVDALCNLFELQEPVDEELAGEDQP